MADPSEQPLKTYRGNCHCGAFVYEARLPEIASVGECNCSYCYKKGYLFAFPGAENFKVVKGNPEDLQTYTFGDKRCQHKFCRTCGTGVFAAMPAGPPRMAVGLNVHTIQDINTWELARNFHDGASVGQRYQQPPHKGDLPTAQIEDGKTYTGGCHCGAVSVAVVTKPLDETFDDMVTVCNCSICERHAPIWFFPMYPQVVLSGDEDKIGYYVMGFGLSRKSFCKVCGVVLTNSWNPDFTQEQEDALPEDIRSFVQGLKPRNPVNLRVLPEVDVSKLKIVQGEGRLRPLPEYVNP